MNFLGTAQASSWRRLRQAFLILIRKMYRSIRLLASPSSHGINLDKRGRACSRSWRAQLKSAELCLSRTIWEKLKTCFSRTVMTTTRVSRLMTVGSTLSKAIARARLTRAVIYNMYLYIGVGGLRALQAFNVKEQTWGSPHANVSSVAPPQIPVRSRR